MALFATQKTITFDEVQDRVQAITETENTFKVEQPIINLCDTDMYSDFGLKSFGKVVGFPSDFVKTLAETGAKPLSSNVMFNRMMYYFSQGKAPFYAREFQNKICGVVSDRYAYFDDDEVMDIIGQSQLRGFEYQYANTTAERLHLRAIDKNSPFHVDGDDSNLFLMFFVDNSMVGQASFKIRVGVYRQVCSNGMIIPMKDFVLCKQVHRGTKDIAAEFNQSVEFLCQRRDEIQNILSVKGSETASIDELRKKFDEEYVKAYIHKHLNTNKSETEKVIVLFDRYSIELGRASKWAFVNAVTEFARDLPESQLERKIYLESRALAAA